MIPTPGGAGPMTPPPPTPTTILVIAGNYRQFEEWRSRRPSGLQYVYVSRPEQMLGFENVQIELVGTWRERKDVVREAKRRGLLVRR